MMSVYAYKNVDSEVMRSSSGGAFIRLCEEFEELHGKGGVAFYGALLDENMEIRHSGVYSAADCHYFQGAKYVKSQIDDCYRKVVSDLERGLWVLFSGTPCQIYTIKQIVQKHKFLSDRLFTIDVLCHGTAQKNVWRDYKNWLENKSGAKLKRYSFRYKQEGWKAYPGFAEFENGKRMINTAETSVFSRLHLMAYSMEAGCFKCPFANEKRNGDVTLGDYWGIESICHSIPYKTGVSLLLCNSSEGESIIAHIMNKKVSKGDIFVKTESKRYIKYQDNLTRPTNKPTDYEQFWRDYSCSDFDSIIMKYIGWGTKYRVTYEIKKVVRKVPMIEIYREYKRGKK